MVMKLYIIMLLLQHSVLSFWLPFYKADITHHENFVLSADASFSEDGDEEMLKEDDTASSHLITDNKNLELLLKKFKQKESPSSLEEKVKIPTPEESYDMEDSSLKIRYQN